jgi:integrase
MLVFFFGETLLKDITPNLIREYQKRRAEMISANTINQQLGVLRQIMKYADAWTPALERDYLPFRKEETEIPRALTPQEQEHFLKVAAGSKRFLFIYCYSLIVLNTACSGYEMRELTIGNVNRGDNMVYVRWGKNKYRVRSVPLAIDGQWAIKRLIERANLLGAHLPEHYLFPFYSGFNSFDPKRHLTDWGMGRPWKELRSATGLEWLQINALRHTALTRFAEMGWPIEIIRAYAGHLCEKMTRHYLQVGDMCKRRLAGGQFAHHQFDRPFTPPPFVFTPPGCSHNSVDVGNPPVNPPKVEAGEHNSGTISLAAPLAVTYTWAIDWSAVAAANKKETTQDCIPTPLSHRARKETTQDCAPTPLSHSEAITIKMLAEHTHAAQEDAALPPEPEAPAVPKDAPAARLDSAKVVASDVPQVTDILPLWQLEREAILNALRKLNGRKPEVAKLLGIGKTTLAVRIHEYKIRCCEYQHNCIHRHTPENPSVDTNTWEGKRGRKGRNLGRPRPRS